MTPQYLVNQSWDVPGATADKQEYLPICECTHAPTAHRFSTGACSASWTRNDACLCDHYIQQAFVAYDPLAQ